MQAIDLLKKIHELPTISVVAHKINEATHNESLNSKSLGRIIAADPSLTAKVLKLSNSAYYGLPRQISSLERAVTVLGFHTVKGLALSVAVFNLFQSDGQGGFALNELWCHSLACGIAAKALLLVANRPLAEQAYVGGILHDIGKIAVASLLPAEMPKILSQIQETGQRQSEVEMDILGFTHQKIGALLADTWNFPAEYTYLVLYHHGPFAPLLDHQQILARAVFAGNKIAKALHLGKSTDPGIHKISNDFWEALGISARNLPATLATIKSDYAKMAAAWDM